MIPKLFAGYYNYWTTVLIPSAFSWTIEYGKFWGNCTSLYFTVGYECLALPYNKLFNDNEGNSLKNVFECMDSVNNLFDTCTFIDLRDF